MTPAPTPRLAGIGVWAAELRYGDPSEIAEAARELEDLGYTAAWIGDIGGELLPALDHLLRSSTYLVVASGVLNIWKHDPAQVSEWWRGLPEEDRRRTLIGLGVSHSRLIGESWQSPLRVMTEYLNSLAVPASSCCLAALRPKMLNLALTRTAGAHTYLMTPDHTASVRTMLGSDALLAVEQGVVLESDPDRAREIARRALRIYQGLPNYAGLWLEMGFDQHDVLDLSDRLVDTLVAWGEEEAIATRIQEHRDAGASHVCIQVLTEKGRGMPRDEWRRLAPALTKAS